MHFDDFRQAVDNSFAQVKNQAWADVDGARVGLDKPTWTAN